MTRSLLSILLIGLAALLQGCAAGRPLPAAITTPPPGNLQLVEVLRDRQAAAGRTVRWGGTVVAVTAEGGGVARIEILERKLDAGGRPLEYTSSDGRFVIRAAPEVDPWRYRVGSEVTVSGVVTGWVPSVAGGEVPVLEVQHFAHWSPPRRYYYDPYYYDHPLYGPRPWYRDPWYPYPRSGLGLHYGVGVKL